MENYVLPKTSIYHSSGSSEGTQAKYYFDEKWFKQDLNGYITRFPAFKSIE